MPGYELIGTPFSIAYIINLVAGESSKQETVCAIPNDQLLIIENIGISSFLQSTQELMVSVMPVFDSALTVYPIALAGAISSPQSVEKPLRRFGSQLVRLYANIRVYVSVMRSSTEGKAQIEVNLTGRIIEPSPGIQPPGNIEIDQ